MDKIEIASLDYLKSRNLINNTFFKTVKSEQIIDTFCCCRLQEAWLWDGIILNVSNLLATGIFFL